MKKWFWLAGASLFLSGLFVTALASMMIAKGGSHVDYCPNLPAGHVLPCMPSLLGVGMGTFLTVIYALPVFVLGSIFVLIGSRRHHRSAGALESIELLRRVDDIVQELSASLTSDQAASGWTERSKKGVLAFFQQLAKELKSGDLIEYVGILRSLDTWGVDGGELCEKIIEIANELNSRRSRNR